MNRHTLIHLCLGLLLLCNFSCGGYQPSQAKLAQSEQKAKPTVVYVVRHAEKDTSDPSNQNPGLTPAGEERAKALRDLLAGQQVGALYTTNYIRTQNTLKPLAEAYELEMKPYEANDFNTLKAEILARHPGQTVVVAGHSNTVLPLLEAFGTTRPVPAIPDSTYDYIFKLTVPPAGAASVEASHFGAKSK